MSAGRSALWAESEVAQKVNQKTYSCEDIKFLWSGLYDRLMSLEGKVRESAGWKDLRSILLKAFELCQEGRWQESVDRYGAQVKGLIGHLLLLTEAFGSDTELEGEALATLVKYETEKPAEPAQKDMFEGVFA